MTGAHLLDRLFDHPHGLEVWRACKGHGSFITLDLGAIERRAPIRGVDDVVGSVHIWVYLCRWVLRDGGDAILTSESADARFPLALWKLVGQTLRSISPITASRGLTLRFSGDLTLMVYADVSTYEPEDDLLLVYEVGQPALCCSLESGVYLSE